MKKLRTKLSTRFFTLALISVILTAFTISLGAWFNYTTQANTILTNYGQILVQCYNNSKNIDFLNEYNSKDYRISIIDTKGKVVYESSNNISQENMGNHLLRPEVQDAINHGAGTSRRYSETLNSVTYYYAIRANDGYIIRISREVSSLAETFISFIPMIVGIIIFVLLLSILISSASTKNIIKPIEKMADNINDVAYEELIPFSRTIEKQRNEIKKQVSNVQLEKDKINALISNMNEGFLLLDMNKNIIVENNSAAKLLGFTEKHTIGENIITVSRNANFIKCINNAIEGKSSNTKFEHKGKNVEILANPIISNGKQQGVICLIINISEQKETEKLRREFTANVSHELKTPLTSISGYAEMIETGMAQTEDIQRFAGKIHKEAGRMIALIGDIIELSQLDEPQKIIEKEFVNLKELTLECFETLANSAEKREITLSLDGDNVIYYGNKSMLYEVIFNLCDNAIRYNQPKGKVQVEIKDKINKAEIIVKDTGIGIPLKHQNRIFERFYRVDKSHSKETGGTGLGLAIVKHIVERHNGKIELESAENQGTTIKIILPK